MRDIRHAAGHPAIPAGFMAGLGATIFLFLCAMLIAGITARIAEAIRSDPYWAPAIAGSLAVVGFTVLYWIVRLGAAT